MYILLDFSSAVSPKICAQTTLNSKMGTGGWNSGKEGKATFTKMASHKMRLQKGPSSIKQVISSPCSFFFFHINLLSSFIIGQIHHFGLNILLEGMVAWSLRYWHIVFYPPNALKWKLKLSYMSHVKNYACSFGV